MFTLLLHIVVKLFAAENCFVLISIPGCKIFRKRNMAKTPENNSLGSLVLVKMQNFFGSFLELRGLTLDLQDFTNKGTPLYKISCILTLT